MSVRVAARIRPLLKSELDKDTIVSAVGVDDDLSTRPTIVRLPNPKNQGEDFSFQFNSVYDQGATQQDIFDTEVAPTVKHLFNGFDVTIFAYGVTGTGKTHTMRGGKTLAERGVIPRLLSGIYRRSRKIDKDSQGKTKVEVAMSYYEIYNDRVFDLFEAPEKRTMTGLQLRDNGGKTVVVGLTERPCESLKDFEKLYDQANINRSTSATKLNAHSSRSHAILCVKVSISAGDETRISTASAIDLAGSEDNRRTDNGKERLVESASINKSLFVLAQCVEAISKKQNRIPYRESKMTRILSLGQNNGLTIMILNLAPVRSYHLDTVSSLNFANRTKKIEVREIENEPVFKGCSRAVPTITGSSIQRQPLRSLGNTIHNVAINNAGQPVKPGDKPSKAFSVYSDRKSLLSNPSNRQRHPEAPKRSSPLKRPSDQFTTNGPRPAKYPRPSPPRASKPQPTISKATIEDIIEKKVSEILAARALDQPSTAPVTEISEEVQRRLDLLEQKIEGKDDSRAEGLTFLLMAKQHHVRGEESSALKMYELAKAHFPNNIKLDKKIRKLQESLQQKKPPGPQQSQQASSISPPISRVTLHSIPLNNPSKVSENPPPSDADDSYHEAPQHLNSVGSDSDDSFHYKPRSRRAPLRPPAPRIAVTNHASLHAPSQPDSASAPASPRSQHLLAIINSRDVAQIRLLKGVGARKAEIIFQALCAGDDEAHGEMAMGSLAQLGGLKGVGRRTVENMRLGVEGLV